MTGLAAAVLIAWLYLICFRGNFDGPGPILPRARPRATPPVAIVVPARDEAATIEPVIASLLAQDYEGPFRVILVDDHSTDATAALASALPDPHHRLTILASAPRPPGWAGKLWAVHQGTTASHEELILLTDADITHEPTHLGTLVAGVEATGAAMVSEMVRLNCRSLAERALIPAFVYFFCLLYPFAWVNDPRRRTAAAAGGTILIRRHTLSGIGGIAAIKGALIDDVALARAVKPLAPIWLGHTNEACSIRRYGLADIWHMITRSAYVQLRFSPLLLAGGVLGMLFLFVLPTVIFASDPPLSVTSWYLRIPLWLGPLYLSFQSFGRGTQRYGFWASSLVPLLLPFIALFYLAATIASALSHHLGRGVAWKGRAYPAGQA